MRMPKKTTWASALQRTGPILDMMMPYRKDDDVSSLVWSEITNDDSSCFS
jgi:hypothetical protein